MDEKTGPACSSRVVWLAGVGLRFRVATRTPAAFNTTASKHATREHVGRPSGAVYLADHAASCERETYQKHAHDKKGERPSKSVSVVLIYIYIYGQAQRVSNLLLRFFVELFNIDENKK
jgi:hypothetical protein